jgi:hypothetical protein
MGVVTGTMMARTAGVLKPVAGRRVGARPMGRQFAESVAGKRKAGATPYRGAHVGKAYSVSAFGVDHGQISKAFNPAKAMKAKAFASGRNFGANNRANQLATAAGRKPQAPINQSNRGLFPKTRKAGAWHGERQAEAREKLAKLPPMNFLKG